MSMLSPWNSTPVHTGQSYVTTGQSHSAYVEGVLIRLVSTGQRVGARMIPSALGQYRTAHRKSHHTLGQYRTSHSSIPDRGTIRHISTAHRIAAYAGSVPNSTKAACQVTLVSRWKLYWIQFRPGSTIRSVSTKNLLAAYATSEPESA
eukprot:3940402-Rhodomonas_salina.1